jgi:N-acetylmuramoyl-L-alanine amidase
VVVEPGSGGTAEIRMRPVKSEAAALASATLKPGVLSVKAHIERKDVLVARLKFSRAVGAMRVIRRTSESVVVEIELGGTAKTPARSTAPIIGARKNSNPSKKSPPKATPAKKPTATSTSTKKARWALTTIVIDAGHGGKDPGAIGIDDLQEKVVTLSVARRLRDELKRAMPGVRIIMTRESDIFVELDRRGEIANRRGGRLFISIHCNSMPEKPHPVSGFECYILRPGKYGDAAAVAGKENDAVRYETRAQKYKASAADGTIVAGMAQSAFARYSEDAAERISRELRNGTTLNDRGIHQAGFYVLVGAAMPAVLVEIGYLTSETDILLLKSSTGRQKIAKSIANGIVSYQKHYAATTGR